MRLPLRVGPLDAVTALTAFGADPIISSPRAPFAHEITSSWRPLNPELRAKAAPGWRAPRAFGRRGGSSCRDAVLYATRGARFLLAKLPSRGRARTRFAARIERANLGEPPTSSSEPAPARSLRRARAKGRRYERKAATRRPREQGRRLICSWSRPRSPNRLFAVRALIGRSGSRFGGPARGRTGRAGRAHRQRDDHAPRA